MGTNRANSTDVECPYCEAAVGDWCKEQNGTIRPGELLAHPQRTRLAISNFALFTKGN